MSISYAWQIKEKILDHKKDIHKLHKCLKSVMAGFLGKQIGFGICEKSELKGQLGSHFMVARVETRALKRAIGTFFGSVVNYFVINVMEAAQ